MIAGDGEYVRAFFEQDWKGGVEIFDGLAFGIEISGTVTSTRTEHGYDGDYWRLGDLRPGASVSFPIALWIETSPQLTSASGLDLTIELVSPDLDGPLVSTPLRVEAN